MRQNRIFPPVRPQPQPEPAPAPSRLKVLRQSLGSFYVRFHVFVLISTCGLTVVATLLLYNAIQPPSQRLTQRDIDNAVERSLATASPQPSFESRAYDVILPSLVQVRALLSRTDEEPHSAVNVK